LPGVKELFQSRKKEEEEENQALAYYQKFMNQGPSYFGDHDELDGKLLAFEAQSEEEGEQPLKSSQFLYHDTYCCRF
jgi:pre-mRNA-splicing factor ISY1